MDPLHRVCLVAAVLSSAACASVPMAPTQLDRAAKTFRPPPADRAHVYIYRNESIGFAVSMDLRLDGVPVGTTVGRTFTLVPVRPGHHLLVSEAENTSKLPIYVGGGEMLFVWQEVKMGILYARNKLQVVSPAVGRAGVSECGLIAYPPPPLSPPLPPPPVARPQTPAPPSVAAPVEVPTP
jgi:hypothetical protein